MKETYKSRVYTNRPAYADKVEKKSSSNQITFEDLDT